MVPRGDGWDRFCVFVWTRRSLLAPDGMPRVALRRPEALDCRALIPPETWNSEMDGIRLHYIILDSGQLGGLEGGVAKGLQGFLVGFARIRHYLKRALAVSESSFPRSVSYGFQCRQCRITQGDCGSTMRVHVYV